MSTTWPDTTTLTLDRRPVTYLPTQRRADWPFWTLVAMIAITLAGLALVAIDLSDEARATGGERKVTATTVVIERDAP